MASTLPLLSSISQPYPRNRHLQPLLRYLPRMNNCRMVLIKHLPNTRRTNIYPETLQQNNKSIASASIFLMALPKKCHRNSFRKMFLSFLCSVRKISLFLLIRPYMVISIKTSITSIRFSPSEIFWKYVMPSVAVAQP